jgi:D-glucosaminate-6-phosphate ammonia-lyase
MVNTNPIDLDRTVYNDLGVNTIINARGATTAVGGTLMPPEVLKAMEAASQHFVVLEDLNRAVGARIAEATGAEAGYVTSGSAAGMLLSAAACITGSDLSRIRRLPDTTGLPNEIITHRTHRLRYDQMFRAAGAELVEIGYPQGTEEWELETAISDQTVAVAYHDSPAVGPTALDFRTVVKIAHTYDVPVIVDAASTLPPVDHLRRWIRWGADLVIYSGGKGIRGPQDSGLLAGRADLIRAAELNGAPNVGIGRGMKVTKESMVGLAAALDRFLTHDHEADFANQLKQARTFEEAFAGRNDVLVEVIADQERFPAPVVVIRPPRSTWDPRTVQAQLRDGALSIHANVELGGLAFHTHCLQRGEEDMIIEKLAGLI